MNAKRHAAADRPSSEDLSDPTRTGAVLAALEAIASVAPFVGGPIAVVLGEIRRSRDTRVVELIVDIDRRLGELGVEMDEDYVRSTEFATRVEEVLDEATRARQTAKRRFYATALKNSAVPNRPDEISWGLLLDALNRIQLVHLAVLAGLANGPTSPKQPDEVFTVGSGAWRAIDASVPGLDRALLIRVWEDLATLGIVESLSIVTTNVRTSTDVPSVIQPFGRQFIEFLELGAGAPGISTTEASDG